MRKLVYRLRSRSGVSTVGVVVGSIILASSLVAYQQVAQGVRAQQAWYRDQAIAELYASELLELFRSLRTPGLAQRMITNPANPGMPPYFYCAHINIVDRDANQILNLDPVASLPVDALALGQNTDGMRANRFYQISVVDRATMAPIASRCAEDFSTPIASNEAYLVTVGVSWVPPGKTSADVRRVVLSSLIPN